MAEKFCTSCGTAASDGSSFCTKCGNSMGVAASGRHGTIRRKSEFVGVGALVQLVGLVLLFVFPIGTVAGVILLGVGSRLSTKLTCSDCGNRIADKGVKVCPVCKTSFGKN